MLRLLLFTLGSSFFEYENLSTLTSCRFCSVYLEEGFSEETIAELRRKGHNVRADESHHARVHFGRGQIIRRNPDDGVLWGGSDSRADGQAIGW